MANKECLTMKTKVFCHYVVQGMSQTRAYMKAFDCENPKTAAPAACKILQRDLVREYIRDLEKVRFDNVADEIEVCKREAYKIMLDEKESTGNRLRALDIINKMNAVYSEANTGDQKDAKVSFDGMTPDELRKLIETQEAEQTGVS